VAAHISMVRTEHPHHSKFYVEHELVTLLVDECLFRVPRRYLQHHSDVFASMFALPQSAPHVEGQADDTPIRLDGAPLEEFEALLDMIYSHELGLPQSTNYNGLTRLAAATRWEAHAFRQQALDQLAGSDDAIAQLVAFRRFGVPEWHWPTLFTLSMRENHLSKEEVSQLTCDDLFTLMAIRETLCKESITDIFKKELRLRGLLRKYEPCLAEPVSSSLPGPRSGYQSHFFKDKPHPPGVLSMEAPFVDQDGYAVYVGSARLNDGIVVPCKVRVKDNQLRAHVPYHGEKVVDDFSILHVDLSRMKWVPVQEMRATKHHALQPVEAGFDEYFPKLYYAYGEIDGVKLPGKAVPNFPDAFFAFGGREHQRQSDFFILVWR
jgi:hypothetical protein